MSDENPKKENQKKENSFIRERIVPRKNAKKILFIVIAVVLSALIFGTVAGVAFSVSRDLFGRETVPTESPIVILPRGGEEWSDGEDILLPETDAPESTDEAGEPGETEEQTEPAPITVQSVYAAVEHSLLAITLEQPEGEDWFNEPQTRRTETFGVAYSESEEFLFVLTDGSAYTEGTRYHVTVGNEILVMEPSSVDSLTGLAILKIPKSILKRPIPLISLGSSFRASRGDRVFLFGSLYGRFGAMDEGKISYLATTEPVTDGYRHLIYTNMQRTKGGAGILVNEEGTLIGWMSDISAGSDTAAVADGIDPLKHLLTEMASGVPRAYFGVLCRSLRTEDVAGTDRKVGLYVQNVLPESPAFYAGVQPGDRIISMGDQSMTINRTLQLILEAAEPGQTIAIVIGRMNNGKEEQINLTVTFGER